MPSEDLSTLQPPLKHLACGVQVYFHRNHRTFSICSRVSAAHVTVNYSQGHNGETGQVQTGLGTNTLDISKHRWEGWPGKGQAGAQLPVGTEGEVPTSRAEPASVPCRNPGNSLLFPCRAAVPARPVPSRLGRQCTPWSPPSSLQDVHPPRSRALRPMAKSSCHIWP